MTRQDIEARLRVLGKRSWTLAMLGRHGENATPENVMRIFRLMQAIMIEAYQLQVEATRPIPKFPPGSDQQGKLAYVEERGPEIMIGGRQFGRSLLLDAIAKVHKTQVIHDLSRSKMMAQAGRASMMFSPQSMQKLFEAMKNLPQWGKDLKHLAQDTEGFTELANSVDGVAAMFNVPKELLGGCHAGFSEMMPKQFECGVDLGNNIKMIDVRKGIDGGWEVRVHGSDQWTPATWDQDGKTLKFSAPLTITNKPDTNGATETGRPQAHD